MNIVEIRKPEVDAKLVAQGIADQLDPPYRFPSRHEACRCSRRCVWVQKASRSPAAAVWAALKSPALNRTAKAACLLHTLRANIDYAEAEALTAYGIIGIKCWIFKGEILGHDPMATDRLMMEAQTSGVRPQSDRR